MARAPWSFKDVFDAVAVTQPASNVRKLPLDTLANAARNATPRVVDAQGKLERLKQGFESKVEEAEVYLATLKSEFEAQITAAEIELDKAVSERTRAQYLFIRETIDSDVFVGVKDLNELARSTEVAGK